MAKQLTYEDLRLQNYLNTAPVGNLAGVDVLLSDIAAAGIFGKLNFFLTGPKSTGKTQLMRDIFHGYFSGNKHGLWEEGRTDFKPKDLFEALNISLVKDNIESVPEIKAVYEQGEVSYLIRSYKESDKEQKLTWKKISKEDKEKIIEDFSLTTDQLLKLRNIDKGFFCIDEYNRCPPVVMNLFYGLMTGEVDHDGKIISLGNGYYSGIAASNPGDYEGTFNMDKAMWARFHIVLDFGAYEPSSKDLDELNKRNLSPDVQKCEDADLSAEIEEVYKEIKGNEPSLDERVILQYFQSGLGFCSEENVSKGKLDWPRCCSAKGCTDATKTCGILSGIDARAIRAVYRLAKGLEKVVGLKENEADIDPVESLVFAYKFVAPYKGCVSPKAAKEKQGIEALVLEDCMEAIKENLADKLKEIKDVASIEAYSTNVDQNLQRLKKLYEEKGIENELKAVEEEVSKEYIQKKKLSIEEIISREPEIFEEKKKEVLKELFFKDIEKYESLILEEVKSYKQHYEQLVSLKSNSQMGRKEFKRKYPDKTYEEAVLLFKNTYLDTLRQLGYALFDSFKGRIDSSLLNKAEEEAKRMLPEGEIEFIPKEKKNEFDETLRERLAQRYVAIKNDMFAERKKKLFEGQWFFLKDFYDEFVEEAKNGQ